MKRAYFTHDNIQEVSSKMLQSISKSHGLKINFEITNNTALIITDMQNYFLDENSHAFVPSAKVIVPNIKFLCDLFLKKNMTIIFTKHTNNIENAGAMSSWWKDLIKENTQESEISSELSCNKAIILEKHQYDAFYKTNLDEILKERQINQLIITGVLTHLCCESTARAAFVHGYKVLFPVNGSATYNIKYHKSSLRNLAHGFAIPVLMEDIISKVEAL